MAELTISPDYVRSLALKVRSVMAKESNTLPGDASNFTDDDLPPEALQVESDDLTREELMQELRGLPTDEQGELVALMWLGRDDGSANDWDVLLEQALSRREIPTELYLLDHPLLAEYWLDGLQRLEV